jgi:RNA polymerase sigma factor (sigma-70 family)
MDKDILLLNRIKKGEKSAFEALINQHKGFAFTIAFRVLNNREDAEEVAQDAFLRVFRSIDDFQGQSKFTTWFYRIVFNEALMRKRKGKVTAEDIEASKEAWNVGNGEDASDEMRNNERKRAIQAALKNLSADDVTMITLFYLKEQSLEEISEIIEISAETAKVKLHRARKRLLEELKQNFKTELKELL